jgi:hypothetical protein
MFLVNYYECFIVSKMVKTLQFIAATLVSMNFNRKGTLRFTQRTPSPICYEKTLLTLRDLCALCVKELQNFIFCLNLWIFNP